MKWRKGQNRTRKGDNERGVSWTDDIGAGLEKEEFEVKKIEKG